MDEIATLATNKNSTKKKKKKKRKKKNWDGEKEKRVAGYLCYCAGRPGRPMFIAKVFEFSLPWAQRKSLLKDWFGETP
jgi:hypothetical protein